MEQLTAALGRCETWAQQTQAENRALKETVELAETTLRTLRRDNQELRSMSPWQVVGLHGTRLHRTWQAVVGFLGGIARLVLGRHLDSLGAAIGSFKVRLGRDLRGVEANVVGNLMLLKSTFRGLFQRLGWEVLATDAHVEIFTSLVVGSTIFVAGIVPLFYFVSRAVSTGDKSNADIAAELRKVLGPDVSAEINADLRAAAKMYAVGMREEQKARRQALVGSDDEGQGGDAAGAGEGSGARAGEQ